MAKQPRLLIATRNPGKLEELASLLSGVPYALLSLDDVGIDSEIAEVGSSFEENATLKAVGYSAMSGLAALADDSGLEVDALGGEPGVLSSRYAGAGATDSQKIAYLLRKLDSVADDKLGARFRCAIAIAWPDRPVDVQYGECHGRLVRTPRGDNGFGYDSIFLVDGLGKTMAELTAEEKNEISHRARAARNAARVLMRVAAEG